MKKIKITSLHTTAPQTQIVNLNNDCKIGDVLSLRIGENKLEIELKDDYSLKRVADEFNSWLSIVTDKDIKVVAP